MKAGDVEGDLTKVLFILTNSPFSKGEIEYSTHQFPVETRALRLIVLDQGIEHDLRVFIVEFGFDEFATAIPEAMKDSDVDPMTDDRIKENKVVEHQSIVDILLPPTISQIELQNNNEVQRKSAFLSERVSR